MRLQLRGLCRRAVRQRKSGSTCACPAARTPPACSSSSIEELEAAARCSASCRASRRQRRRGSLTSHPAGYSRDNPVDAELRLAPPPQQGRLREGDLARRARCRRAAASTMSSATSFGVFPSNDAGAGRRDHRRARRAAGLPDRRPHSARELLDGVSLSPAPDMLFQLFSYIAGGERRQKAKRARRRRGSRRRCRDARRARGAAEVSRTCGPIPKRSSRRWSRCSRGSTRSRRRRNADPGRVALTVDAVRYEVDKRTRLGVASTFLADRIVPGDKRPRLCAEGARASPCPPIPPRRSS